ncbi:hypothetical protein [Meiothermus granaticius]|uniref:Uncharacterized protein n=1 Tax=Meiothermus granaticius NBRC 107808 TaxID=1227551 RepID=A0A399F6Q3_9DEIN|nr:hypothetical protein [Meiothermus granaticius]RIH91780.1 hypothetical protein Mgrana_02357 [Meiothermus granaticius NBRC 107808]GEM88475.1 hypothetical protein MGR01S_31000 [Meiothermus granaticius NBRC 107808]
MSLEQIRLEIEARQQRIDAAISPDPVERAWVRWRWSLDRLREQKRERLLELSVALLELKGEA